MRREQLNATFRKGAAGDEEGEGEGDEEEKGEGDEEEKGEGEVGEGRGRGKKPSPKAKAKSKAKAKAKGKAKAKAKSKAVAKSKAKAQKAGEGADNSVKKRPSRSEAAAGDGEGKKGRKSDVGTFARRYRPTDEASLARFNAIEDTFKNRIAAVINRQSTFQDLSWKRTPPKPNSNGETFPRNLVGAQRPETDHLPTHPALQDKFYSMCMQAFRGSEATTYDDYLLLAQGQVSSFLQLEDVSF